MAIQVVFDKHGFYHPAFGRMGRGDKNRGKVYTLPDQFSEKGMLPKSATVVSADELEDVLEDAEQAKPIKPKVVDEDQFQKTVAGRGKAAKPDSAQKRTTGSDKKPIQ